MMSVIWIGHTLYNDDHGQHKGLEIKMKGKPMKCTDNTTALKQFQLTTDGKPINVFEYVTRLAGNPHSHVLKILDFNPKHLGELKKEHVDQEEDFWEMTLEDHKAESRCSFVRENVKAFCQHFSSRKQELD